MYQAQGLGHVIVYVLKAVHYRVVNRYLRGSYAQKGEDLLIDRFFHFKKDGFYVDIGASHPQDASNTKIFYDKGWRGINVEPNPGRIALFARERPRDINLNIGVGSTAQRAAFYQFEPATFSTFSRAEATMLEETGFHLKRTVEVPVKRLEDILDAYSVSTIDFMSVDTEGLEMEVLDSNNWRKYRPTLLCIETIDFMKLLRHGTGESHRKTDIDAYLLSRGYEEYFSNGLNTIYRDVKG